MIKTLGNIISGSLVEGLIMRVSSEINLEELKAGKFVCICGTQNRFFSLITDLKLEVSNNDILLFPPTLQEKLLKQALKNKDIYATATLRPLLMLANNNDKKPVKTLPTHFATVQEASNDDIKLIFGDEKDKSKRFFTIGTPLDMPEAPVCLDFENLTERSNGIFGKTGTGKTFLTRLVLAGLVHTDKAVNLIFDMHSEYGVQARKEGSDTFVKGLKTLFPDKIAIFSLDPESTRRRGNSPDVIIDIPYNAIAVEDIISLNSELNLNPTAYEAAQLIQSKYKNNWLEVLLNSGDRLKDFAQEIGAHAESIAALYRKLKNIERLPFISPGTGSGDDFTTKSSFDPAHPERAKSEGVGHSQPSRKAWTGGDKVEGQNDVITKMIEYIDNGISIIIEFGNYTSTFCYLLIANIVTRRIHTLYTGKTEKFLASHNKAHEPKKLMITIEEAHKFLNSQVAHQTIFGTIAREMRKYYVSLLVVDQRPSSIDPEVLSQIGTKIVAQLNDEKDIQAVLNGVNNAHQLRAILATLETKKQAVIMGHAIAMPVVIQTREYDENFYKAVTQIAKPVQDLIGEFYTL